MAGSFCRKDMASGISASGQLRGLYMNYKATVPGPIAKTTEEVIRTIKDLHHFSRFDPKYKRFYEKFCTYGRGDSSKRAAEYLLGDKNTQSGEPYYRNLWKKKLHQWYVRLFRYAGHLPRKKMVLFESFFGTQYSDSPRAIYEYMKEHCPDYKLIWNVQRKYRKVFQKEHVPYVIKYSFSGLWKWARANYWVTNCRWPLWLPKPEETIYIQTWHGTPLKTLGTDIRRITMPGMTTARYKKEFTEESRKWDYCIAPNDYASTIFKRAFEVQGTMIRSGYPRNDLLIQKNNESDIMKIKEKLGIDRVKKVILYAPTWRDNQFTDLDHYTFDMKLDLDRMKREFGRDAVLLIRQHYLADESIDLSDYEGSVMDVSGYEDCRELFLAADCLITDYSSVFFDYAVLKRPIIFFAYDLDDYANKIRGFYLDFRKMAPGPVVNTMDQLIPALHDALAFTGGNPYPDFYKKFCSWEDGYSAKRAVTAFLNHHDSK
jgi:Putative glycosyl/glycerophosphate transferases involved in teichoic acid biosynthesis TagF/TagB/EpsJ/RodC